MQYTELSYMVKQPTKYNDINEPTELSIYYS